MDLQTIFAYGFILIFIITETWIKRKTKSNNEITLKTKEVVTSLLVVLFVVFY